ncbi:MULTISPECIES: outer membrane protein assembly factor BamE [unclassified Burkholderia]|uniref:outer membrane protein assembly factor BamE n=1 Tax=unclassified Burkholderia TaxID=2613784 RepID=UPI00084C7E0F|nr:MULTISPECIES: outer membrane protein assembly factor BamE [unclassified Burkholderia]RQU21676.1 outer membrane protein assembly factor BamE [Burkholderia cenocepacia]MBR8238099.1 outer membrane protein assembly factor BamE [Burkholderia sp. AU32357]MBY4872601.1 outer membrane protein assembly factor BamE [Burkholderia sp. AU42008]OED18024.1 cell envelope protein SmpA [Burkholderia sp. A2]OXI44083.1 outer membrane protein assembly factor BamE [Burkholderia sp. AU17457]
MRSAIIAAAAVVALAGCSSYDSVTQRIAQSITPYRITVVQGNFVSQEKAAQLQVGMTREQVRALLGTPLLADMFHADRWDYLFYFKRGSTSIVQQRDLVINFSGDRVASWTGADNLPSELDLLADIDGDRGGKKAKAAAAAKKASEAAAAASAAQAAAAASPAAEPASGAVVDQDANAQAARAANRATNQVSGQGSASRRFTPAAQASGGAPVPGGQPPGAAPAIQPQFQFHRPPQPNATNEAAPPVGPQGSDNLQNQPLTAPAQ